MLAQQLRTIIISLDDLEDVWDRLKDLQNGKSLTAVETGVADEDSLNNAEIVGQQFDFDGFKYTVFLWVTTG